MFTSTFIAFNPVCGNFTATDNFPNCYISGK
jgi:hypothetical protein